MGPGCPNPTRPRCSRPAVTCSSTRPPCGRAGKWATTNVVVRTAFLQQHPATVQRFLQGLVDTLTYIQAQPAAAQAAFNTQLASLQGGKPLSSKVLSAAWKNLTFTADPLASTLQTQVDHGVAVGLLKPPSNLAGIYDLTLLNQVLAAEGQPQVSRAVTVVDPDRPPAVPPPRGARGGARRRVQGVWPGRGRRCPPSIASP